MGMPWLAVRLVENSMPATGILKATGGRMSVNVLSGGTASASLLSSGAQPDSAISGAASSVN